MLNSVGLANPGLERVRADELPWLASHARARAGARERGGLHGRGVRRRRAGLDGSPGDHRLRAQPVLSQYQCGRNRVRRRPRSVSGVSSRSAGREPGCRWSPSCRRCCPTSPAWLSWPATPGADAITRGQHHAGLLFGGDGSTRLGNGNGGVSGPALLPVGVLAVARVVERTGGMPVIGVGASGRRTTWNSTCEWGHPRRRSAPAPWPIPGCPSGSLPTWSAAMAELIVALDLPQRLRPRCALLDRLPDAPMGQGRARS